MKCPYCGKEIDKTEEKPSGWARFNVVNPPKTPQDIRYIPVYGLPPLNDPAAVVKAIREKWEIEAV